jgi:mannitol-1-/sugar-/sorbitol-6-phosphatase
VTGVEGNDLTVPSRLFGHAVLFDCDGVLVDSDASVAAAWTAWAYEYGIAPKAVLYTVHGRRASDTVAALISGDATAVSRALLRINELELQTATQVSAIPGALDLLSQIPDGSWAVVTSGTRALAAARLSAAGISPPAVIVTADDVTAGKPSPEAYLRGARLLGIPAGSCIVVEDAENGVNAARSARVGAVLGVGVRARKTDADLFVDYLVPVRWTSAGLVIVHPSHGAPAPVQRERGAGSAIRPGVAVGRSIQDCAAPVDADGTILAIDAQLLRNSAL